MAFERLKFPPPTRSSHLRCSSSTSMALKVGNGVQHILGSASRNISSSRPDNLCICNSPSRQMIYLWLLFYPFFFKITKKTQRKGRNTFLQILLLVFPETMVISRPKSKSDLTTNFNYIITMPTEIREGTLQDTQDKTHEKCAVYQLRDEPTQRGGDD